MSDALATLKERMAKDDDAARLERDQAEAIKDLVKELNNKG